MIDEGRVAELRVSPDEDPEKIAEAFCAQHNLDTAALAPILKQEIEKTMRDIRRSEDASDDLRKRLDQLSTELAAERQRADAAEQAVRAERRKVAYLTAEVEKKSQALMRQSAASNVSESEAHSRLKVATEENASLRTEVNRLRNEKNAPLSPQSSIAMFDLQRKVSETTRELLKVQRELAYERSRKASPTSMASPSYAQSSSTATATVTARERRLFMEEKRSIIASANRDREILTKENQRLRSALGTGPNSYQSRCLSAELEVKRLRQDLENERARSLALSPLRSSPLHPSPSTPARSLATAAPSSASPSVFASAYRDALAAKAI